MDRSALPPSELCKSLLTRFQARRVQFRLQSAQECSQMVGILERRGMEFQQQRPRTRRQATVRSEVDEAGGRPLTTQTYSAKSTFSAPAVSHKPNPFNLQTLEAGGLSSQTSVGGRRTSDADQTVSRQPSTVHTIDDIRPPPPFRMPTIDVNRSMPAPVQAALDKTAIGGARNYMAHDFDNSGRLQTTSSPARPATTSLYQPSAPASLRLPETLEHEMPPRRELPFKRPGSHQSASSRPCTSANSASHSTAGADSSEPTVASSALSSARNASTHRSATASPLKGNIAPSHLEPVKQGLAIEMRPQTQGSLVPSVSSPLKPTAVSTKATDTVARASSVVQGQVDGVDSALADYAAQSREDRQAVLDEFMVSKLEDPNFAVLCEDLDSCWRRIALGL